MMAESWSAVFIRSCVLFLKSIEKKIRGFGRGEVGKGRKVGKGRNFPEVFSKNGFYGKPS